MKSIINGCVVWFARILPPIIRFLTQLHSRCELHHEGYLVEIAVVV